MLWDATKGTLKFLTDLPARDSGRSEILLINSANEWVDCLGESRPETVLTIGNFDGVHLGHQKILRDVVERAAAGRGDAPDALKKELLPAVLTFYPHPARVLRPQQAPSLLETLPQRLADFAAMGIGAALVLQFDAALAQASAEDFAKKYLVDTMRAQAVLVGASFRFGHKQLGDVELLQDLGRRWGFEVVVVTPVIDGGDVVSSTAIRDAARGGRATHVRAAFCAGGRDTYGHRTRAEIGGANIESCDGAGDAAQDWRIRYRDRAFGRGVSLGHQRGSAPDVRWHASGHRIASFRFRGSANRWPDEGALPAALTRRAEILRAGSVARPSAEGYRAREVSFRAIIHN